VASQPSSVRIVIMIAATGAVATAVVAAVQVRTKREFHRKSAV
jgi:hypothetical protein